VGKIKQKLSALKKKLGQRRRDYLAGRPHKSFRKTKLPRTRPALATLKQNTLGTFATLWRERRIFIPLAIVYMVATYIFIGGVAQNDFVDLKEATAEVFGGSISSIDTALSLLSSTISGAFGGQLNELQQFLVVLFAILLWLAVVWALRMRFANEKITARDALYSSGAPLVSYVIVGAVIMVQLTPGALGLFVYNLASSGGYLQGGVEVMTFVLAAVLLGMLSLYWLAGSLTALVVVTLPQMYPWKAVRIASELAVYRRSRLFMHVIALVAILLALWVVVLLPILLLDSWLRWTWLPLIPLVVQVLSALTVLYMSTYVYKLYRSML